ncbi:DUF1077-domain-containing protein [Coccomyxa subellipsoidea C-169]|uniref:ER membrane protein complex subunit 4 n=1 Tax=Coccomyxa subellipsoidea (strain C-169) TaxID=574566 RepID=I0YWB7_COCSC|nr:DUF1077-domain-containing protein [Coccomyxa subellipsoidea C-169]EIE22686.1 DUF1077-domain-containing protein [Coccomyxa subellipsoidea C-169]|eukprot:XP_005647230.1 DUF1077-domain-containing protein [Coccomyxa subellipsoidea C-169]
MSEFLKYSVRFESNQSGTVDRKHVGDPPGYEPTASRDVVRTTAALWQRRMEITLISDPLYSRATGTVKNIGFMCFMMWMSGSQIHLFSIMMTVSGIYQPLAAIMNSKQTEASEGGKLEVLIPRLLYCLIQAGGLAFGLWKLNTMGLLPTHASDYVSSLKVPASQEFSTGGVQLPR